MSIRVRFFAYYRDLFGGRESILAAEPGLTVGILLSRLCDTPRRKAELLDADRLRKHVIVMVNGEALDPSAPLNTPLRDGDVVSVFPLMAGG